MPRRLIGGVFLAFREFSPKIIEEALDLFWLCWGIFSCDELILILHVDGKRRFLFLSLFGTVRDACLFLVRMKVLSMFSVNLSAEGFSDFYIEPTPRCLLCLLDELLFGNIETIFNNMSDVAFDINIHLSFQDFISFKSKCFEKLECGGFCLSRSVRLLWCLFGTHLEFIVQKYSCLCKFHVFSITEKPLRVYERLPLFSKVF